MKNIPSFVLIFCFLLLGIAGHVEAATLLVSNGLGYGVGGGYGGSDWDNMTAAINTAFGGSGNVTRVTNFDSATLTDYDAILVNVRNFGSTLSATEITKIQAFAATGKRVLLVGENASWDTWNDSILGVVGTASSAEASGSTFAPTYSHALTTSVTNVYLPAGGRADAGTTLFSQRFATLWGDSENTLVFLDINLWSDSYWANASNAIFAANVANWLAGVVDTDAPTITNVTSDKANGTYTIGEVIDIDVTFSEAVTSTGNVTVTLETGATDRTCTFTVTSSTTGTCNYTVQSGDTSLDLTTASISGTIDDAAGNDMVSFTPATNLAANKALVIDGAAPVISETTPVSTPTENTTPTYEFTSSEAGTISYGGSCSSNTTTASVGINTIVLTALSDGSYDNCTIIVTDAAGNASSTLAITAFTITIPVAASNESPRIRNGGGGPAPLPDPVKVASTSENGPNKSAESLNVSVGEKFTLRVKAPDADSVKSVIVKINGEIHSFTLEEINRNPVFLSSLALQKPGKYPYTISVDYGSFVKKSLGTVVVQESISQKKLPVIITPSPEPIIQPSSARLILTPRTVITSPSPEPTPQEQPSPSSIAPSLETEERILDIQLSTIFDRTTQGSMSLIARAVTSSKSVASTLISIPKRMWSRIAKQFQNNRYEKMTIRLASAAGDPLVGATVVMHSEPRTGITDQEGKVTFTDVERGKHELDITYQEYKSKQEVVLNHDVLEVTINITAEFRKE